MIMMHIEHLLYKNGNAHANLVAMKKIDVTLLPQTMLNIEYENWQI